MKYIITGNPVVYTMAVNKTKQTKTKHKEEKQESHWSSKPTEKDPVAQVEHAVLTIGLQFNIWNISL